MAFFQDVSPSLLHLKQCELESFFHCCLSCILAYACFRTIFKFCHPFSQFLFKFRLCAGLTFLLTVALHWGIIKLFPVELILGIGYFHRWIVKTTMQDMLHYGLVPRTRQEIRVLDHTARLRKLHRHYVPGMHKVVFIGLFIISTLVQGFTVRWGSSHCHPYHPRRPPLRDGRQRLFHHRHLREKALLRQYSAALSPRSTGWESKPAQHFPISQRLQVEAMLLGQAFDRLALHFPPWDYHRMPPDLSFTQSSFADPTIRPLLQPDFPNIREIFGDLTPFSPKHIPPHATCSVVRPMTFPSVLTLVAPCHQPSPWMILRSCR